MRNILTYLMLGLALVLSSCNDWLDVSPKTQKPMKQAFKTEQGFQDALTACYIKLNESNLYGSKLIATDIELLAQHWSFNEVIYAGQALMKNFRYETDYVKASLKTIYSNLYNVIAQANSVLENIPAYGDVIPDEDVRAVIEAEALGIRAFCHMDILRLFGQMPQHAQKKVELPYVRIVSIADIPCYGFDDFVNLILQDIDAAMALLKDRDPLFEYTFEELDKFSDEKNKVELADNFLGYRRFRFNYYALKALKARLYMYLGNKPKAYEEAKGVIEAKDRNGNKVLTLAGEADLVQKNYALPSECILALSNYKIGDLLSSVFEKGTEGFYLTTNQHDELFAGKTTNRSQIWKNVTKPVHMKFMKYHQSEDTNEDEESDPATQKQVVPIIRLSEMYLIAMEASTSLSEVNTLYQEYLEARGSTPVSLTENQVMAEILQEYRREFFGEGVMFYTYKRLGVRQMLWKNDREVGENDYVAPLPDTEIKRN